MRPEISIIPRDFEDERFTELIEAVLKRQLERIPDALWDRAYRDIFRIGHIRNDTLDEIMGIIGSDLN